MPFFICAGDKKKPLRFHGWYYLLIVNISSFITLFIQSSCKCLGLLGGAGLLSGNKSDRTVPTVLCRSGGSVPSQNRACCFCEPGLSLSGIAQHSYSCGFPCGTGRVQRCLWLCPGRRKHSRALSGELPREAASSGRPGPGTAPRSGCAPAGPRAGAVRGCVCPLPDLQPSKEHGRD